MIIKINWDEATTGFNPIDEGIYEAKVFEINQKTSKSGNPYLNVTFQISSGKFKNRRVFGILPLTDSSMWKFYKFLNALGLKGKGTTEIDTDSLIGRSLKIFIRKRVYKKDDGTEVETSDVADFYPLDNDLEKVLKSEPKNVVHKEVHTEDNKEIDISDIL